MSTNNDASAPELRMRKQVHPVVTRVTSTHAQVQILTRARLAGSDGGAADGAASGPEEA